MKNKSNAKKDKSCGTKNKTSKADVVERAQKQWALLQEQLNSGKYTDLVHYIEIEEDIDHYQGIIDENCGVLL